jgi:CubicO group peptidase (beta-lactamase class C family)
MEMNAHQLARYGYLFLNQGRWGSQQLIEPEWVAQATCVQVPAYLPLAPTDRANLDGRGVYGCNWWLNGVKANGLRAFPNAPVGTFYAAGLHNNHCFVVPEWNLVFVRMGRDDRQKVGAYDRFFALFGAAIIG